MRGRVFLPQVTGNRGMPSFKIRPKALSRHGRQLIMELSHGQPGGHTYFNVAKQSRLSTMSIRHNFEVRTECPRRGMLGGVAHGARRPTLGRTVRVAA